ncbi:MAG: hypothetical protein AAF984_02290 [Verrucomicrobiota bacterium]
MKSAYELAMERLAEKNPAPKLTEKQKEEIKELNSVYESKIAERETFLRSLIAEAQIQNNFAEKAELEAQLSRDVATIKEEWELKKKKVWDHKD